MRESEGWNIHFIIPIVMIGVVFSLMTHSFSENPQYCNCGGLLNVLEEETQQELFAEKIIYCGLSECEHRVTCYQQERVFRCEDCEEEYEEQQIIWVDDGHRYRTGVVEYGVSDIAGNLWVSSSNPYFRNEIFPTINDQIACRTVMYEGVIYHLMNEKAVHMIDQERTPSKFAFLFEKRLPVGTILTVTTKDECFRWGLIADNREFCGFLGSNGRCPYTNLTPMEHEPEKVYTFHEKEIIGSIMASMAEVENHPFSNLTVIKYDGVKDKAHIDGAKYTRSFEEILGTVSLPSLELVICPNDFYGFVEVGQDVFYIQGSVKKQLEPEAGELGEEEFSQLLVEQEMLAILVEMMNAF